MSGDAPPDTLDAAQWRRLLEERPLDFEVTSNSMAPTFVAGERVRIRALNAGEPRKGQVAAYFTDRLVTHRCAGPQLFQGDHLLQCDPPVEALALVGIVEGVYRKGTLRRLKDHPSLAARAMRLRLRLRRTLGGLRRKFQSRT